MKVKDALVYLKYDTRPVLNGDSCSIDLSGFFWKIWVGAHQLGPEKVRTMDGQNEARGNSGGGSKQCWRANRLSDLSIGAKD